MATTTTGVYERLESEKVAASVIVFFSSVACMCGNGLVMMSYFTCPNLRSQPGSVLVANLALSDFFCGSYIQIPAMINLGNPEYHLSSIACLVHSIFTWSTMTVSNWSVAAISLDRAIAINLPFKHRNLVTNFRVR